MDFKNRQKVEIINGFYKGLTGIMTDERITNDIKEYIIEIDMVRNGQSWLQPVVWIVEKDLKSIN